MSVVVYENDTMVGDGLISRGGQISTKTYKKVFNGVMNIHGSTGIAWQCNAFHNMMQAAQSYELGIQRLNEEYGGEWTQCFQALVKWRHSDILKIVEADEKGYLRTLEERDSGFHAIGSGSEVAYMARHYEDDLKDVVEKVCMVNIHCGGEITEVKLNND